MRCYANETLTCVDRYTDKYLQISGISFQYAVYRDGLGDLLYVTVNWYNEATTNRMPEDMLQCRVGSQKYDFARMDGWEDPVCVLPYSTDETNDISGMYAFVPKESQGVLRYNFEEYSELALYPGKYDTLPSFVLPQIPLYGNHRHSLKWTLTTGDDRQGWVSALELRYRDPGADTYVSEAVFTDAFHTYCYMQTDGDIIGKEVCLMLEYRTYDPDWNGNNKEDFTTLNRMVSPWQTVQRDGSIPLPPESISTSMLLAGGKVTVQWSAVQDPLHTISAYRLERAVVNTDGVSGSFVQLYKGTSAQFRDTLPGNTDKVLYRVCSVNRTGTESPWTETGTLEAAQSNLYVSRSGTWVHAAGVWIGEKRASPMLTVERK